MRDNSQTFNISLPKDLVKDADRVAKQEFRTRSELIREALRRYLYHGSEGRQVHGKAEEARLGGNLEKALELIDQALVTYQKEKDIVGFTEGLASKVLTLRQLHESTNDPNYLILAKHTAASSVEIAQTSGNKESLALPLENLARIYGELGDWSKAVETYREAVKNQEENPLPNHRRPALLLEMKAALAVFEYMNGDKKALAKAEKFAEEILKVDDPAPWDQHAWYALSLMKMAGALKETKGDLKQIKDYLGKAKQIIDSDPEIKFLLPKWEKIRV